MLILIIENNLQALEKIAYSNNWITILTMIMFVGVVLLKAIDSKRLKRIFFSLFNVNLIESDSDEKTGFLDVFQIVLFLFTLLILSLIVFKFNIYKLSLSVERFSLFFSIFLVLSTFFLIKRTLEHLFSILFLIKKEIDFFIKSKYNYLYAISFLLYIAMILCEYANFKQTLLLSFSAFLLVLRFVLVVVINKKLIFSKLFYFILYFCAFEIAPLFILFKLMF